MSRLELARAVGVSAAAVYQWEGTGESQTTPSVAHLTAIAAAFGLTMERFFGQVPRTRRAS